MVDEPPPLPPMPPEVIELHRKSASGNTAVPIKEVGLEELREALSWAKIAVTADRDLNYPKAVLLYRQAAVVLKTAGQAPSVAAAQLGREYEARAAALESVRGVDRAQQQTPSLHRAGASSSSSAAATPLSPSSAGQRRRITSLSKVPFRDMQVHLGTAAAGSGPCEPPPPERARRTFWKIRMLRRTVQQGGFISPRVFVPREVWLQHGAKLAAMSAKVAALHEFSDHIGRLPKAFENCGKDVARFLGLLGRLNSRLEASQNALAVHLSYVSETDSDGAVTKKIGASISSIKANTGGIGQLWKDVRTLGVLAFEGAKKGATTAIVKIGNIGQGRLTGEDLAQYAKLLLRACDACVHIDDLILHFTVAPSSTGHARRLVLDGLERMSYIVHSVVVAVFVHDLRELLERYLRKTRKSYARRFAVGGDPDDDE